MVRKSYGKKRGTRHKLRIKTPISIMKYLEEFIEGDKVHIKVSTNKKIPHMKFHGMTGTVISKRGRGYIVQVKNKDTFKKITIRPEHLRK